MSASFDDEVSDWYASLIAKPAGSATVYFTWNTAKDYPRMKPPAFVAAARAAARGYGTLVQRVDLPPGQTRTFEYIFQRSARRFEAMAA